MQLNFTDTEGLHRLPSDLGHLRLLTDVEVSALTGLAVQTLRKRRLRQVGPPWIKIGAAVRYRVADIETYFDDNRVAPEAA